MGKTKKSFYKKQIKPFVKNNRVLLAALTGAAAAIGVTKLLATEQVKQAVAKVEDNAKDLVDKVRRKVKKQDVEPTL